MIVLVFRNIEEVTEICAVIVFPAGCLEHRLEHKHIVMCVVIPSVSIEPNICTNLNSFKEKETFEMGFDGSEEFLGQRKEVNQGPA